MAKNDTETKVRRRKEETDVCPVAGAEVMGGHKVLLIGLL